MCGKEEDLAVDGHLARRWSVLICFHVFIFVASSPVQLD